MAEKMAEKQLKRRRINGTHRWSDAETLDLVQQVSEEVKDKPESFEKPTAQLFYKKISGKSAVLSPVDWVPMKNKMRHLKSTYMSALNWKNQTGAGLLATGDEQSVKEYIEKICPQWNHLEQIFGQRQGVNPSFILETSTNAIDIDIDTEEDHVLSINNDESMSEVLECDIVSFSEPSPDLQSPDTHSTVPSSTNLKESIKKLQHTTPKSKNVNPFSLLLSLQEKKLEIEVKKFELEKEMAVSELELKKAKLEQDFEIRKLQLESEERIKKYELEVKYKSCSD